MPSTDKKPGEPVKTDKEYIDIIESESEYDKEVVQDTGVATKIVYYCRDCKKSTKPKRIGNKFKFSCTECKGSNVAFGSEKSINSYYKISK